MTAAIDPIKWEDVTSYAYSRVERGQITPVSWQIKQGPLRVVVTRVHGVPDVWFMQCPAIGISEAQLSCTALEEAQGEALGLVASRVTGLQTAIKAMVTDRGDGNEVHPPRDGRWVMTTTPKTPEEWFDEWVRRTLVAFNLEDLEPEPESKTLSAGLLREAMAQAWWLGARWAVFSYRNAWDIHRGTAPCPYADPKSHGGEPDPAPTPAEDNAGESGSGPGRGGGDE